MPLLDPTPFHQIRFVLVETSHAGNVGSTARALKTMGFARLVLVSPRKPAIQDHEDAIALASGASDVLRNAKVCATLDEALHGVHLSIALTARPREFGPQRSDPRSVAAQAATLLAQETAETEIALVFGNERYGLSNEDVQRCSRVVHIPANPDYSSLNLAQAVQLIAWELRMALLDISRAVPRPSTASATALSSERVGFTGALASAEQIEGMFEHLEHALIDIGYLDPSSPKRLMPRLRRLLSRTQLEVEEVNILRGIAKRMQTIKN